MKFWHLMSWKLDLKEMNWNKKYNVPSTQYTIIQYSMLLFVMEKLKLKKSWWKRKTKKYHSLETSSMYINKKKLISLEKYKNKRFLINITTLLEKNLIDLRIQTSKENFLLKTNKILLTFNKLLSDT